MNCQNVFLPFAFWPFAFCYLTLQSTLAANAKRNVSKSCDPLLRPACLRHCAALFVWLAVNCCWFANCPAFSRPPTQRAKWSASVSGKDWARGRATERGRKRAGERQRERERDREVERRRVGARQLPVFVLSDSAFIWKHFSFAARANRDASWGTQIVIYK